MNKKVIIEKGKLIMFPREGRICHCLSGYPLSWSQIVDGELYLLPTFKIEYDLLLEMVNDYIKKNNLKDDYIIYERGEGDFDSGHYAVVIFEKPK